MEIVDGKKIAGFVKEEIKELLKTSGKKSLGIFYVGKNPVIESYINKKVAMGKELEIEVEVLSFDLNISEADFIDKIEKEGKRFSGIIVQLPLPENFDRERVLSKIPREKDADILSKESFSLFVEGKTKRLPPVVSAVEEIFKFYNPTLAGKKIVIVGKGVLVGRPLIAWFSRQGIDAVAVDKDTENIVDIIKEGDIVISGTGVCGLIKPSMVKEGCILIDAGTSTSNGKISGDVDKEAYEKASLVSPVPGGVGPITVVSLFKNLFLE